MINGATVTLAGYVATEPHYQTINDKTPKVSMRVAWTSRFMDRETGEWRDGKGLVATHCHDRHHASHAQNRFVGRPAIIGPCPQSHWAHMPGSGIHGRYTRRRPAR